MNHVTIAMRALPVTWILVADAGQAKIYARASAEKRIPMAGNAHHRHYAESQARELEPVPGMAWEAESPETYETGRDRLGSVFESGSKARHKSEPHREVKTEIRRNFVARVAAEVNKAYAAGKFERLMLAAPPKVLGDLRAKLDEAVQSCIMAELAKDLTRYDDGTLLQQVRAALR